MLIRRRYLLSNEIVKYDPELNTIPLRKFSSVEMNLFFSIISRMRDKGDQIVRFTFDQLKELSDYKPTSNKRFENDIQSTYQKLMSLHFSRYSKNGKNRELFVMFTKFKIVGDCDVPYVDVELYKDVLPLLNNLERWVRYALHDFKNLRSTYSKTMFRLLKQYRTTGNAYFSKSMFNELLDIPQSYKNSNINQSVLRPIKEELTPLFKGFSIHKKYGKGRGKPVIGYYFSWKPESNNSNDFSRGKLLDQNSKIFNVKNNADLTKKEKWIAIDKVKGLPLGSTEKEEYQKILKEHDCQISQEERDNFFKIFHYQFQNK